jgi:hypothetical protein
MRPRTLRSTVAVTLGSAFALLYAYASWLPGPDATARPLDRSRFLAAQQANVRQLLLDPDSARFRNSEVSTLRHLAVACGEVNERGPGGGYGEFRRFVSGETIRLVESERTREEMDRLWRVFCDPDGVAPMRAQ